MEREDHAAASDIEVSGARLNRLLADDFSGAHARGAAMSIIDPKAAVAAGQDTVRARGARP